MTARPFDDWPGYWTCPACQQVLGYPEPMTLDAAILVERVIEAHEKFRHGVE